MPINVQTCRKVCLLFNLACQCAKDGAIFQLHLSKGIPIFQLFFKIVFKYLNFLLMLNICKFPEYLGNSKTYLANQRPKLLISAKFHKGKNFINIKPLTLFSIEQVGLTEQIFALCKMELNMCFCLSNLYTMFKKVHSEKHTSCKLIRKLLYCRN